MEEYVEEQLAAALAALPEAQRNRVRPNQINIMRNYYRGVYRDLNSAPPTLTPRFRPENHPEATTDAECPVCFETGNWPTVCENGHKICYRCANQWSQIGGHETCPYCRTNLNAGGRPRCRFCCRGCKNRPL